MTVCHTRWNEHNNLAQMYPNCWLSGGQVSKRFRLQLEHNFLHFKLHNSILGVIYSKDYNTTPSTYVLSKGSLLTLQVNQFLINMEKRIFALLRGLLIVPSNETTSKIVRTGRMRSIWIFSSIFIQRNRCINLLPSSPPLPPPPLLQTRFLYTFYKATNWCWWGGGGFVIILIPNSLQLQ